MKKYIVYSMLCAMLHSNGSQFERVSTDMMDIILFHVDPICYKKITEGEINSFPLTMFSPEKQYSHYFINLALLNKTMREKVKTIFTYKMPLVMKEFYENPAKSDYYDIITLQNEKKLPLFSAPFSYKFNDKIVQFLLGGWLKYTPGTHKEYELILVVESSDKTIQLRQDLSSKYKWSSQEWEAYFTMCLDATEEKMDKIEVEKWISLFANTLNCEKDSRVRFSADYSLPYMLQSTVHFHRALLCPRLSPDIPFNTRFPLTWPLFFQLIHMKCFIIVFNNRLIY